MEKAMNAYQSAKQSSPDFSTNASLRIRIKSVFNVVADTDLSHTL